ncbi:STAS domain-containing protein [Chloroflexia bacterium SDU3-3]|nr:STAS domain-containing protein [Chloroflexia bacterium SDU3-3]
MTTSAETLLQDMMDSLPMLAVIYERLPDGAYRMVAGSTPILHTPAGECNVGKLITTILCEDDAARATADFERCLAEGVPRSSVERYTMNDATASSLGKTICTENICVPLPQHPGQNRQIMILLKDITAQMQQEQQEREHQEALIAQQAAALAELSTPLLAITDETVVMPIIGTVDSRRVVQIMGALLEGVAAQHARTVILDITGVPIVDTQVANALIHASQAVKLLGAQVVLTGIRPEVAQTIVGLGVELGGVVTLSSLQSGIAYALRR